jgi:8-oxo-dGTP pyrophosphatase MutT (NUDIX family)
VFDPKAAAVLLMHHKKLQKWLQPGGHCDGNSNFIEVAQKELWEETGLKLNPVSSEAFDLDIHSIPASSAESAHLHYDWRVLFTADSRAPMPKNDEGNLVKWVPLLEISEHTREESILRMVRKAETLSF